jgi:hypothetical protein
MAGTKRMYETLYVSSDCEDEDTAAKHVSMKPRKYKTRKVSKMEKIDKEKKIEDNVYTVTDEMLCWESDVSLLTKNLDDSILPMQFESRQLSIAAMFTWSDFLDLEKPATPSELKMYTEDQISKAIELYEYYKMYGLADFF